MKTKGLLIIIVMTGLFLSTLTLTQPPLVYAEQQVVTVSVDGLACPFCAYGLEKKLKKLEGVEKIEIRIDKGTAVLTLKEGKTVDLEEVKKAVEKAGFTPKEIEVGGQGS